MIMKTLLLCFFIVLALGNERQGEVQGDKKRGGGAMWSKTGLAWPDLVDSANIWALAGNGWNKVSWLYTWSVWENPQAKVVGLDWVPMFWGTPHTSEFQQQLNAGAFSKCTAFLGFNEPERSDQANLSPQNAANLWKQYIQPLKTKYPSMRLGAPAVSSAPAGKVWLQQFFADCTGCTIDFVPLHWYGSGSQNFINYVTDMHNTFKRNVWVTEFAWVPNGACNIQNVYDFVGQTTLWMDQQSWVERWAYFGAMKNLGGVPACNRLITADGKTNTPLGVQYATGGHS